MKRIWSEEVKNEARQLRIAGFSYSEIVKKIGVPKSTLHSWIFDLPNPNFNKEEHLKRIQKLAVKAIKRKKLDKHLAIRKKIHNELNVELYNIEALKNMLSMLYWAEGGKTPGFLVFANTDPELSCFLLLY